MKLKHLYLALALIGMAGPYYFLITFLTAHGLDGKAFLLQLFCTQISTLFAVDLLVSSVGFVIYVPGESRRCSINHWWLYLIALCAVGLSFALPLFLYVREDRLADKSSAQNRA